VTLEAATDEALEGMQEMLVRAACDIANSTEDGTEEAEDGGVHIWVHDLTDTSWVGL
jgi:hypothetical protein